MLKDGDSLTDLFKNITLHRVIKKFFRQADPQSFQIDAKYR